MSLKDVIKSNWKPIVFIPLAIVAAIVGTLLWRRIWNGPKQTIQIDNPLLLKQVDSFRDANGKLYAELEEKVYTQAQVTHLLDSTAKALGIRVKTINGIERIIFKDSIVYRDTAKAKVIILNHDTSYQIEQHDAWNDITAVAGRNGGYIKAYIWDSLTRIDATKNPLFGPMTHQIYLTHSNPSIKTIAGASFTIKEKQPWLSIGPTFSYNPFSTSKLTVGIGIAYPLLTLKR